MKSVFTLSVFRGSKDWQELWTKAHFQNLHLEVCQCLHSDCISGLFQGKVTQWYYMSMFALIMLLFNVCFKLILVSQTFFKHFFLQCSFFIVWFIQWLNMWWFLFLRLVGRPGNYLYVVGSYRMEEVIHTKKSYWKVSVPSSSSGECELLCSFEIHLTWNRTWGFKKYNVCDN